jgi:ABC-2 type transport system ATP-binding protein
MSLKVDQLTKIYGIQKALDHVSFEAHKGQILGFLGPNGAGKSTTMKIASGFMLPDAGDVYINGVSVIKHPRQVSAQIGYLPENNPLYLDMYVGEFLSFMGRMYGLKGLPLKKAVNQQIESCGLTAEVHKKISQLSKGYKQRVGLAKSLIHDPSVVILDEPTTGLDPNQLVEIRRLIKEVAQEKTLILSTHILQEVEALCDKVVIINQGKIVSENTLSNLKSGGNTSVLVLEIEEKMQKEWFNGLPEISYLEVQEKVLIVHTHQPSLVKRELVSIVQEKGLTLTGLRQTDNNLEAVFRKLTQDNKG